MQKFVLLLSLITVALGLASHRLSTLAPDPTTLRANESLMSTLGNFKLTLVGQNCSLRIEMFNNQTNGYDSRGSYNSPSYSGSCSSLRIMEGRLETDTGRQFLSVQNQAHNYSTTFTIDDQGVLRLISTYIQQNRVDIVSRETVIETFKVVPKYIRAISNLAVSFGDSFAVFTNQRNWRFISEFGQLTIYYGGNSGIKVDYVYSAFTIRDSRIYDFNNQTFPGTLFTNVTFQPRCADPKNYIEFKPPYVFRANPYWPILQVYEQGGYKILEVAYGQFPQYDFNQNITEVHFHHYYSPCPRKTFEFRGDCVAQCPPPFYHQIKGENGFCVLFCEEFSEVDEQNRVCGCVTAYQKDKLSSSDLVIECPSNAVKTPYGCRCNQTNKYYDSLLSFTCVEECPNTTVGINQICMKCPENCITCDRDGFNREFLECKVCMQYFTLFQGQCIPTCIQNYGNSLVDEQCIRCQDINCVDCTPNASVCIKCNLLYTLSGGQCYDSCSPNQRNVYSDYFSSLCVPASDPMCTFYLTSQYKGVPFTKCDECFPGYLAHLETCVPQCPAGYRVHNGYCVCDGQRNLTIHDRCFNQKACPIGMSFDIRSHSCLSCPFGCMSCLNTQCTSCNPGYFLYVSPQNILCRKKGPLFPCNQQYSWQRDEICMITNYTDPNIAMTLCYSRVPNCIICVPQSAEICVVCAQGFFIYNNTCISECPEGLIPYSTTCILPEIERCEVPHLITVRKQGVITNQRMGASQAYQFYIYSGSEPANDPVGYMPYFQQLTTQRNDGIPRQNQFGTVTWTCLKCQNGFGLNQDMTECLPCPQQCTQNLCYWARNDSCLYPEKPLVCNQNEFVDEETGQCLQSCNSNTKYPQIRDNQLYCVSSATNRDYARVDSAVYQMKDGRKLVYFVFRDQITGENVNVTVRSINPPPSEQVQNGINKVSQQQTPTEVQNQLPISDSQYVELNNQNFNAFVLNLNQSILNLKTSNELVFPNKVYGTVYQADHTSFMRTWLAYIGYIMSICILLLHIVFIGNQLLYKVDNLLIFTQSIFYFSFVQNLVGRLLAQFYFGWSFALARFLPNIFDSIIPDHYVQNKAPISFKLVNMDGNYFRNAGFSLGWLLIYIAVWAVITFIIWALIYQLARRKQAWMPRVAKQAIIAGFQFFSMNLVFFSVTQLAYSQGAYQNGFQDYYDRSQALAIISLIVVFTYTLLRLFFNPLGGIYMLKRSIIAIILAFSYEHKALFAAVVVLQILFALFRHVLEKPPTKFNLATIYGEELLFIACYALLYFCLDAGVNTILISVFIFLFIVYLAYDLTTIYLESRHEFPEEQLAKNYSEDFVNQMRAMTVNNLNKYPGSPGGSGLGY